MLLYFFFLVLDFNSFLVEVLLGLVWIADEAVKVRHSNSRSDYGQRNSLKKKSTEKLKLFL